MFFKWKDLSRTNFFLCQDLGAQKLYCDFLFIWTPMVEIITYKEGKTKCACSTTILILTDLQFLTRCDKKLCTESNY